MRVDNEVNAGIVSVGLKAPGKRGKWGLLLDVKKNRKSEEESLARRTDSTQQRAGCLGVERGTENGCGMLSSRR